MIDVLAGKQIEIVEALAKEIWSEHYVPIIGQAQVNYMLEKYQSKLSISEQIKDGYLYFLMNDGNRIIGYMAVQPKDDELFLSKIYVRSSERGKGYGRKGVYFAEKLAKEKGLKRITLTVNKNNLTSIKVYERFGFQNHGSIVQDIGSGFIMDDYKMEKKL